MSACSRDRQNNLFCQRSPAWPRVPHMLAVHAKPPVIIALPRLTTQELAMVLAQDLPHARRPANAVAIGVTAVWAAQLAHRSAPARSVPPGWPCSASTRLRSSGWRLEEASARPGFCGAMAVEMNILRRIQAREWTARRASRLSCFSGLARQDMANAAVIFGFDSSGPLLVVFTADPNREFTRQGDRSAKRERQQARAKQHETRRRYRQESARHQVMVA